MHIQCNRPRALFHVTDTTRCSLHTAPHWQRLAFHHIRLPMFSFCVRRDLPLRNGMERNSNEQSDDQRYRATSCDPTLLVLRS